MRIVMALGFGALLAGPLRAQEVIDLSRAPGGGGQPTVTAPPSVDDGIADGIAKRAGAPSVGNGVANGVVKRAGSPSVGDGVANGVVKSSTVNQ